MIYSQKYSVVHFIKPVEAGAQFHMSEWPLHITLADVFAIDRQDSGIDELLVSKLSQYPSVKTTSLQNATLGTTDVILLDNTQGLLQLHTNVVTLLIENGAIFNTPEFNGEGFIPHSTIQQTERLGIGEEVVIDTLSLVDMFPGGDWQQRKVLSVFTFSSLNHLP